MSIEPLFQDKESKDYLKRIDSIIEQVHSDSWWGTYLSGKARSIYDNILLQKNIENKEPFFLKIPSLAQIIKAFIFCIRETYRIINCKKKFRKKKATLNSSQEYYLLKSFFYPREAGEAQYNDPFFRRLPNYLESKGKKTISILNTLDNYESINLLTSVNSQAYPFYTFCSLTAPTKAFFGWLFSKKKYLTHPSNGLNYILKRNYFSLQPILSSLIANSAYNLANSYRIKKAIYVYEGNFWENYFVKTLKEQNIETVGYQHNIICDVSYNYFIGEHESQYRPMPTTILTTGTLTAAKLKNISGYKGIEIHDSCALRYEKFHSIKFKNESSKSILVALETLETCDFILDYLLKNHKHFNGYNFVLRAHPARPLEKFRQFQEISKLPNFSASTESLQDDLERTSITLYWGSTVAFEALRSGHKLIHLANPNFTSPDPLNGSKINKWTLNTNEDISLDLDTIYSFDTAQHKKEVEVLFNQYFAPVTEDALQKFL